MMTVFEKAGRYPDIIDLSIGDPDLKTPQKIIDLAFADAGAGHTKYTDPWGDPELREEIARFYAEEYGVALGEREIFVSTAGCVAMYLVMEAILDPGDEVLIFDPYFSAYATQVRLGGGVPVFVPCREADGWQPDMERAAQYLTPRTKALVINTPNNPTGVCYSRPTLEAVARFARKNDLLVVADDIYTSFCYSEPFLPVLTLPGMKERTVAINSFSKNFVMTGFRVGNIVAPEPIARAVKSINDSVVYSAPAPSQRAALHALRRRKELAAQIVPEFSARMAYGAQRIRELPGFTLSPAGGGIYLFPGVGPTGLTSAEACERILEEAHVLMLPGSAFGDAGEGYLRIACTVGLDKMEEAFGRMAQMPMLQGR
jgi:aspartate/methionine/tyrosine aminotransferase